MKFSKVLMLAILMAWGCSDDPRKPDADASFVDSGDIADSGDHDAMMEDTDATVADGGSEDMGDGTVECFSEIACSTFVDGLEIDGSNILVPRTTRGAEIDDVIFRGTATESNAPTVMVRATGTFESGEFVEVPLEDYNTADRIELTSANITDSCGDVTEYRFRIAFAPGAEDLSGPCF